MVEGEKYELPVLPDDFCHWERLDEQVNQSIKYQIANTKEPIIKDKLLKELDVPIEVKQTRSWSDGKRGYIETS
jgi:hypothetical protein